MKIVILSDFNVEFINQDIYVIYYKSSEKQAERIMTKDDIYIFWNFRGIYLDDYDWNLTQFEENCLLFATRTSAEIFLEDLLPFMTASNLTSNKYFFKK